MHVQTMQKTHALRSGSRTGSQLGLCFGGDGVNVYCVARLLSVSPYNVFIS